jgi:4-amino-4-deoxy-L-arabinose transferase-like glycosyltransferase
MTHSIHQKSLPWTNIRWLTAVIGLGLFVYGQFQLAGLATEVKSHIALGDWLNQNLHFGIPDINNVLVGLPILILGAVLLAISLRGLVLSPLSPSDTTAELSVGIRSIKAAWLGPMVGTFLFAVVLFQLNRLNYTFVTPILWIVYIFLFAITIAIWDHRRQVDLSPHLTRSDLLWLAGLLTFGILIAAYRLQGWPDQLMGDEGIFWSIARDIAMGTFRPAIFANGVYSFPILSSYLQAWIMQVFGINVWGWRMASVLPGVITVIPLYLLARDAFNKRIAVVSSIVLITFPYFLAFSRLGYNNIQVLFINTLAFYWLYIGVKRSSFFLLFLAGCACGLGFYTYFGARGAIVIAILYFFIMWLTKKIKARFALLFLGVFLVAFILVTAPYFVYGIHQDAVTMGFKTFESLFLNVFNGRQFYSDAELFKYAPVIHINGNDLFYNPRIYAILVTQGLVRTLLAFQKPWLISEHFISFPLTGTIGVIFYLLGLGLTVRNIKQPRNQLLLIWFLTCIFAFSALNTVPPRHTHMVAIIPVLALFVGIGLNGLTRVLDHVHGWFKRNSHITISILLAVVAIWGLHDYFVLSPRKYHQQPDQIMSWAGLNSNGESFLYIYKDPSQANFKPYALAEIRKDVDFKSVSVDELGNGGEIFASKKKMVVFFTPEIAPIIIPQLQTQWGFPLNLRIFDSSGGIPVLTAVMNTPFTFERDRSFISTLFDPFRHLSFVILLALLLLGLAMSAFLPASLASRLPAGFSRLIQWLNRPAPVSIIEELPEPDLLLETKPADTSPPVEDIPPEWATQFSSPETASNRRWSLEVMPVRSDQGRDVFIRLHLPTLKKSRSNLPPAVEIRMPHFDLPANILFILSIFLAITAQFFISRQSIPLGIILYGLSAAGLIFWAVRNRKWTSVFHNQIRFSPRVEILFASLLLLAVAFTRFYDINQRVYGLEADETKWTVQSWYSTILNVDQGEFASAHYDYLPVSFWVRSFFLRVFGLNFISARIESAFLSLVSAVFLYFIVRRLTHSPPTAFLSTLLYAFSFVELNESHQALHNTTVEIWMMSGLFLTVLALQERKSWQYQLAGIVLALGTLTYETIFATPVFALFFVIGYGIYRLSKKQEALIPWLKQMLLFIWPIVLVYIIYIGPYLASQQSHFDPLTESVTNGSRLGGYIIFFLKNASDLLHTTFINVVWTDSLINWGGPFIDPLLLVFVVIGLIYNLWHLRRPFFLFIPLWYLANILAAPILVGSVWPRVLYTSLAPTVIWGAMGLWLFLAALRSWFTSLRLKFAVPVFVILLLVIVFNDYHIFTSSLLDPLERQKRRELADFTAQSSSAVPMVVFPFEPAQNDSVFVESHLILFSVASGRHNGLEAEKNFQQIVFDQTLPTLWQDRHLPALDLIFDKTSHNMIEERLASLSIILRCYPGAVLDRSGEYFDVYHFEGAALGQPACYQAEPPLAISPAMGAILPSGGPIKLSWETHGVSSNAYALFLEKKATDTYWIETEETFQGPGWVATAEYLSDFLGSGFLMDTWEAGTAQYTLPIQKSGEYRLWIRSYKRQVNDQVNSITINGQKLDFSGNENELNTWIWEDMGVFSLNEGQLPLELTRSYGTDPEYSVFIDTVVLTPDLDNPPDKLRVWQTMLSTGIISSTSNEYTLRTVLPPGDYRWYVRLFDGNRLIDSTGEQGVTSPLSIFTISPAASNE